MIQIRPAGPDDGDFLRAMLYEAVWPAEPRPGREELHARPDLLRTLPDWTRAGDAGVIAERGGLPIGAAWYRLFSEHDHAWGFVDASTPELGIALAPEHRGRGIGLTLLDALVATAREQDLPALSLCTSRAKKSNAVRLYERAGFVAIAEVPDTSGTGVVMMLRL
jgi:ribosomal protein S18 acetylase RimI-like enzyme